MLKLDSLTVWQGSSGEPVSILEIEQALLDVSTRWPGVRVSLDPWQLKGSAERLRGRVNLVEFTMTAGSVSRLSQTLYSAITARQVTLYPDAELEHEILSLETKITGGGWRMDHSSRGHNDRSTALALAIQTALDRPYLSLASAISWEPASERKQAEEKVKAPAPDPEPLDHAVMLVYGFHWSLDAWQRHFRWLEPGMRCWVGAGLAAQLLHPDMRGKFQLVEFEPASV